PFPIGAGRTQGIWIDVYIPPDAPAGSYTGTVQVLQNSSVTHQVPVTLQVYDFTLPDTTHFHTMFAYGGLIEERHGLGDGTAAYWDMMHNYMNVFHRHRLDLNLGNQTVIDFDQHLGGYYTGTYYSSNFKYDGPGVGTGNQTYGIGVYDQTERGWESGFWPNTAAAWQAAADGWELWFRTKAPTVERFKYLTDEPKPDAYDVVIERANWIRNSLGIGRNLRTYCTVKLDPRLYGAITFWSLTGQSGYDPGDGVPLGYISSTARQRQSLGEKIAFYNGTRPGYGQPELLDNVLADNRVNPWIAFKYNVDQYFLWIIGFITGLPVNRNVWVDNYNGTTTSRSWAEGQYVYPGEDTKHPADSRGVKGPIVSMRMKNFRRGMQDYEYLWLARQAGVPEDTIAAVINSVVPAALDQVPQNNHPSYAERGYPYEAARRRLAELLGRQGNGGVLPQGTFHADPTVLPAGGGQVTLRWTSTDAQSASLDNGIGTVALNGSMNIQVQSSSIYRLFLQNATGSRTLSVQITVQEPTTPTGTNLLTNPGFENGTASWYFFTNGAGSLSSTSPGFGSNTAARLDVTQAGTNIQLFQSGLHLDPNSTYTLQFAGYSNSGHDFSVSVIKHTLPFTNYGLNSHVVDLPTAWGTHTIQFTTPDLGESVTDGRIYFWLASHAAAGDQYFLDGVTLTKASGPAAAPAVPVIQAPQNLATGVSVIPTIRWGAASGAQTYHLQVARDAGFQNLVFEDTSLAVLTREIGPLSFETTYHARVRAKNSAGASAFSSPVSFVTITENPAVPILVAPFDGAIDVPLTFTAQWLRVPGATSYDLQLSKDSQFNTLLVNRQAVPDTFAQVSASEYATQYYIRVASRTASGVGPFSGPTGFTTVPDRAIPPDFALEQNYPNPFNPITKIKYHVPAQVLVRIVLHDILGRQVAVLADGIHVPGVYEVVVNSTHMATGVYFYTMQTEGRKETRKLLVLQ
ncbi:MAG: carbohydrate binding domain-containing protein, partial [Bacteroidetes bacterium]|nr:carbohydrate binding domain-containing protein [Bacteroidota bacterium]